MYEITKGMKLSKLKRVRSRRLRRLISAYSFGNDTPHLKKSIVPFDELERAMSNIPRNEVVLGVYGSEDWIVADMHRNRHLEGKQTLEVRHTWLTSSGFSLSSWVLSAGFEKFTFFNDAKVLIPTDNGLMIVVAPRGKIEVQITGEPTWVQKTQAMFDAQFKRAENLIEWVYNTRGETISVPLNYRKALKSAYPWINQPLDVYFNEYLESDANVLILIGPPGTGKTTFIKNLIHHAGGNARVAYDEQVLSADDFFAGFVEDECRFLIMEDADNFLNSRQDGNSMMHRFLNVSDGLISSADKKIVFSTNLPNIRDIDSALLREGRCFDVVQFRNLTRAEAQNVCDEVGEGKILGDGSAFSLAELFKSQPSNNKTIRSMGFV